MPSDASAVMILQVRRLFGPQPFHSPANVSSSPFLRVT
jgi:hypothetical protein